jgi:hypothetical protein
VGSVAGRIIHHVSTPLTRVASRSLEMPFLFYYAKNNVWKTHEELVGTLRVDVEMIDDHGQSRILEGPCALCCARFFPVVSFFLRV